MKKKEEFVGFSKHEYNPLVRPKTEALLREILLKFKPKNVLEIGTFIGYSASLILEACPCARVVTLEKDAENFEDACKNLEEYGGRVELFCCDAIEYLKENEDKEKFDLIFLDGPKGQYHKYLPFLKKLLNIGGVLVCDDVLFYGLVNTGGVVKHKHRSIVEHLRKFLKELQADLDFDTKIYDFEDGVSVSIKKK